MEKIDMKCGIETHVQLNTQTKAFCGCKNPANITEEIRPNTLTCETCLGLPGSKPRVNKKMIELAIKVALALNCKVAKEMFFSRKTYFYPDMNKNFQITQYEIPLAKNGFLEIGVGVKKKIRIRRIHLEEDPAKLIHKDNYVLVDYNRAGIPLIEIVTEPDLSSPKEARLYVQKLATILEYLRVYEATSEASMKSDTNISIKGGEKIELKNITGTREIEKALAYEVVRQMNVIKRGGKVKHETRGWDAKAGISKLMRAKETEEEYGYIADPDLTKQEISKELIDKLKKEIPELPDKKLRRFMRQYHVSNKIAEALVSDLGIADLFEHVAKRVDPRIAGSWIAGPLLKTLNWHGLRLRDSGIKKEWITELLLDFSKKKFTDRITEEILRKLVEEKKSPAEIIKKYGLKKIERLEEIESIVADVLERNQRAVDDFRSGKREALHFLIGQVIRSSKGAISATKARKVLLELLG